MYKNIVLFYPKLGWMDAFILDLPLSILYAAHECLKRGVDVRIIDQRIEGKNWQDSLKLVVDDQTCLIGFSAMSGTPIVHALEATRFAKKHFPDIPTAWGGMHATICPGEVLLESSIDYIVRGLGSKPLYHLFEYLSHGTGNLKMIDGLGWEENGYIRMNPMSPAVSYAPLDELSLEKLEMSLYTRFNYDEKVYSLFTSFGCPHKCKFCFAPIFFNHLKGKKWFPYDAIDVSNHIEKVVKTYDIGYLSLLDENFFLDKKRAAVIFQSVLDRRIQISWGIRGARVDDLDKTDNDFLKLMSDVGVRQIMIGAESGSQRMLDIMQKNITVKQIVRVNKMLAEFPNLTPSYNFLSGLPGETIEDMYQSVDLMLQLLEENTNASISGLNQFAPFPGSALYDSCVELGFNVPKTLEEWSVVDTHYNTGQIPWFDREKERTLHSIQAAFMFADNKVERELAFKQNHKNGNKNVRKTSSKNTRGRSLTVLFQFIVLCAKIYKPIATLRLKKHFFKFPIEYIFINWSSKIISQITNLKNN